ncbi:Tripartite-type tricarboxylate transporter, receptor component TctC [Bradyrhizobium erythrophlei]|uniref:Tripartite-type tricarboxylate transporter, receptor component TctC n=2 Tax=Bradyrhizobium erythrophlei TaxID=1437360 RepID=A0A1M7T781_9BRAD|nr:Tripartite-type tricarboxylate transporter, receptor component TctC [Bradyrhizobium erythrophlei]
MIVKMTSSTRTDRLLAIGMSLMLTLVSPAATRADEYPSHPIKMVVPFEPGGGTDLLARLIAERLSASLHQPVIVENRPGAGTQIGASAVARATPDGYTLLSSSLTTYAFNPSLYRNLPYDPARDFAPVSLTGRFAFLLVVSPAFAANSLADLIAMAKASPDKLVYASAGSGSPHQLAMELLLNRAGVRMVHVPYKGAAAALKDVISGQVPVMMLDVATAREPLKAGLLRVLASASPQRSVEFPDVPTVAELGYSGYEASAWQGIVVPAKTPPAIVAKLNREIRTALGDPAVREKLQAAGIEPIESTPEDFAATILNETQKWRDVIKAANISPN